MQAKDFFIHAIRMVEVDGGWNVPTVVAYPPNSEPLVGGAAAASARERHELHFDFKVELGNIEPGSRQPRETHNPLRVASDFVHKLLKHADAWLRANDLALEQSTSIVLAEPLSLQTTLVAPAWLSNYRNNLDRMLRGRGFANVDFLPEPFAVFQYYRHGLRHPTLVEGGKKQVLVIDLGGGTCDICVIETTREGNISQTGRNSRPLAAASEPVAGYFFNRVIATELFRKYATQRNLRDRMAKGIDLYSRWRRNRASVGLSSLPNEYVHFVRALDAFAYEVEDAKLALCKTMANWDLDTPLPGSVPVAIPADPFSPGGARTTVMLGASEIRDLFIKHLWMPHLKNAVSLALARAREDLQGAPISVVLLSGGTANIGWVRNLLLRDFANALGDADVLRLPDFQEVVAKGLAVECARRFHAGEGDFTSQTYNRLCLVLASDDSGQQLKRFSPRTAGIPASDVPGVLLPSSSALQAGIGKPITWRVKLDRPPRHHLDYHFLRSSFDPEDVANLQNVEERTVHTPPGTTFDGHVQVELTVAEDGTAKPRFVYRVAPDPADSVAVSGRPFYLDMTYGKPQVESKAYIGFDFGTSNSAMSFIDQRSVEVYKRRSSERFWNDLSDLVAALPYPIAAPLAKYLGQVDPQRIALSAGEVLEGALAVSAYVTYLEYCTLRRAEPSRLFKSFTQRSAGPLWALLKDTLRRLGSDARISAPYLELLTPELLSPLDQAISAFAQFKHGKSTDYALDTLRPVQIICNISHKVFTAAVFGFAQQVTKQRFSSEYRGLLRHAHGTPPFLSYSHYHGTASFSDGDPFILDKSTNTLLPIQPLFFWDHCPKHTDSDLGHCYIFDGQERNGDFSYKAVGHSCVARAILGSEYEPLVQMLNSWREQDPHIARLDVGDFIAAGGD